MVESETGNSLSEVLKSVSHGTRRALLTQLCQQGPCRVTDLANYYEMSLNAISKHIKVLEKAGLVRRHRDGRTHWIEADLRNVSQIDEWLKELRSIWELRLDKLNSILQTGDQDND